MQQSGLKINTNHVKSKVCVAFNYQEEIWPQIVENLVHDYDR